MLRNACGKLTPIFLKPLTSKNSPDGPSFLPEESFDSFFARHLRRAPLLAAVGTAFVILRSIGFRAGAGLIFVAATALIPLSVLRPELGLYALTVNFVNEFDSYYQLQKYVPFSLPILLDLGITMGILLQVVRPGKLPRLDLLQNWLLVVYVLLVSLSLVMSDVAWPANLWGMFRNTFLIRPIVYVFLVVLVCSPGQLYWILLIFFFAHSLAMAGAMSDFLQKGLALYRVRGTLTAINYLSYVCITTLPILLATFLYLRQRVAKGFMLALALTTLFISFRTLSRSGYYSLFFTLAFLAFRLIRSPRMLFTAVVFSVLFYSLVPTTLTQRLSEVESLTTTDRFYLSRIGLRIALDHPVFGVGWHAYELVFPNYDHEGLFHGKGKAPHSLYLAIAASSGFPALFAYLALYGITFAQMVAITARYQRARNTRSYGYYLAVGIEGGLFGHFFFGLAGSYADSYYAFFLLGIAVAMIRFHHLSREAVLR